MRAVGVDEAGGGSVLMRLFCVYFKFKVVEHSAVLNNCEFELLLK